jgi:hypothetical protein
MLICHFLYDQIYPDSVLSTSEVPNAACLSFTGKIHIHNSAVVTFHTPSDPSSTGGIHLEHIRAIPSWRKGPPRYDCAFLSINPDIWGMLGMSVMCVHLFFSFKCKGVSYPCALVHWYKWLQEQPDDNTGLWILQPKVDDAGDLVTSIIHLNSIICAAHLVAIFGEEFMPKTLTYQQTLDVFKAFYVNKYIDHHAFDLLTPELH